MNTLHLHIHWHTYTHDLFSQDNRCEVISVDPDAPELPPRLEEPDSPFTEQPPNYGEVCDKHSNTSAKETAEAAHSNDVAHDNITQANTRTFSDSNECPTYL